MIQQRLCEALFVAGDTGRAGQSILCMVDREVDMSQSIKTWVSGGLLFSLFIHTHPTYPCRFHATLSFYTGQQ